MMMYAALGPWTSWFCFVHQSTSFSSVLACPSHPVVSLTSIYHVFPYFVGAVRSLLWNGLLRLWWLLQPPSFPYPLLSLLQWADRVPVLSSSSLFQPTVMNQAWASDVTPTAAAEPLLSLLPSTSHCSYLPNPMKNKKQMSFYTCLRSFHISFASHSKLLFLIIAHKTLSILSLSVLSLFFFSLSVYTHTHIACCVT